MRTIESVTPQSISAAKAHQQQERAKVTALTGVQIADTGVIQLPPSSHRVVSRIAANKRWSV